MCHTYYRCHYCHAVPHFLPLSLYCHAAHHTYYRCHTATLCHTYCRCHYCHAAHHTYYRCHYSYTVPHLLALSLLPSCATHIASVTSATLCHTYCLFHSCHTVPHLLSLSLLPRYTPRLGIANEARKLRVGYHRLSNDFFMLENATSNNNGHHWHLQVYPTWS